MSRGPKTFAAAFAGFSAKARERALAPRAGFTLLEVLIAIAVLGIALLAQQPSEADLNKLAATMDSALGVRPGAVIADIGTGLAVQHPLRIAGKVAPVLCCCTIRSAWPVDSASLADFTLLLVRSCRVFSK